MIFKKQSQPGVRIPYQSINMSIADVNSISVSNLNQALTNIVNPYKKLARCEPSQMKLVIYNYRKYCLNLRYISKKRIT